jgi:hypothetical protein
MNIWCAPCESNGRKVPGTWHLPQSIDAGGTVIFVVGCDEHRDWWWEGADWDGRYLEQRILTGG